MKKNLFASAMAAAVLAGCLGLAACSAYSPSTADHTTAADFAKSASYAESQPPLQPYNDHNGRWEALGTQGCMGCHGVNDKGKPVLESATAVPEDHFVNGDKGSGQLDANRAQCIQCHPVAEPER
ncbi:nitrate reductase cytochrome c-type subunit [Curtanaerobium respiraculi]|uniref:nitrate reductase cytochrome c-type subunit n=1 Tax=Curtanaerobium respiraculi TaxID=2949669 RepID=UPI0024B35DD1|nr:nitrate reductase cytochrome c-type subunit [Curtanaerobium respiraculi]